MVTKRYTPETFNVVSSADEIGALIDIQRINGEALGDYKKRILESSKKPSNSTYDGLINAINRDLGLDRELVISINLKDLYYSVKSAEVVISNNTLTDNRSFSGLINASSTVCVGNKLTTTDQSWVPNELIGLTFTVQGLDYKILSNTENEFIFDGDLSGLSNDAFTITVNWETNSLVGLALLSDNNKFVITSNTNNIIQTDTTDMQEMQMEDFRVQVNSPRVHITSSKVVLYKDYLNEENFQLEKEIDIRVKGLSHSNVIDEINSSRFFTAENLMEYNQTRSAFTFKKQDSDMRVVKENIPPSKFFRLENKNIKEGSLSFSQTDVFFNETRDLDDAPFGPYYLVNHKEGIIQAKKVGTGNNNVVTYTYMDFPFKVEASPAVVTAFADETSEDFLFTQQDKRLYDDPRDKKMSIQPKSDMIEYTAELLRTSRQTWGE